MKLENLFGIDVFSDDKEKLLRWIEKRLDEGRKTFLITLNTYMIERVLKDDEFFNCVKKADLIVPDGEGIVLALKILKNIKINKIAGIDLMLEILKIASRNDYKVFLLGSKRKVVEKAKENLEEKFGNVICGINDGYFKADGKVLNLINSTNTDILFVGMGSPRQELWIEKNMEKLNVKLFMGVGGSFDVISGLKKRAPYIFRKLKLEWLFRMFQDPKKFSRLGLMFKFVFRILMEKFRSSI